MNRTDLLKKLSPVTSELLTEKGYIAFTDVFVKLGYLDPKDLERWRLKQVPYLEKVIKVNLGTISFIMKSVRKNCLNGNLRESWTCYRSWGKGAKISLRFSKSDNEHIEKVYATHFLFPKSRKKNESTSVKRDHIR